MMLQFCEAAELLSVLLPWMRNQPVPLSTMALDRGIGESFSCIKWLIRKLLCSISRLISAHYTIHMCTVAHYGASTCSYVKIATLARALTCTLLHQQVKKCACVHPHCSGQYTAMHTVVLAGNLPCAVLHCLV